MNTLCNKRFIICKIMILTINKINRRKTVEKIKSKELITTNISDLCKKFHAKLRLQSSTKLFLEKKKIPLVFNYPNSIIKITRSLYSFSSTFNSYPLAFFNKAKKANEKVLDSVNKSDQEAFLTPLGLIWLSLPSRSKKKISKKNASLAKKLVFLHVFLTYAKRDWQTLKQVNFQKNRPIFRRNLKQFSQLLKLNSELPIHLSPLKSLPQRGRMFYINKGNGVNQFEYLKKNTNMLYKKDLAFNFFVIQLIKDKFLEKKFITPIQHINRGCIVINSFFINNEIERISLSHLFFLNLTIFLKLKKTKSWLFFTKNRGKKNNPKQSIAAALLKNKRPEIQNLNSIIWNTSAEEMHNFCTKGLNKLCFNGPMPQKTNIIIQSIEKYFQIPYGDNEKRIMDCITYPFGVNSMHLPIPIYKKESVATQKGTIKEIGCKFTFLGGTKKKKHPLTLNPKGVNCWDSLCFQDKTIQSIENLKLKKKVIKKNDLFSYAKLFLFFNRASKKRIRLRLKKKVLKMPHRKPFFCYWLLPFIGFVTLISDTKLYLNLANKLPFTKENIIIERRAASLYENNNESAAIKRSLKENFFGKNYDNSYKRDGFWGSFSFAKPNAMIYPSPPKGGIGVMAPTAPYKKKNQFYNTSEHYLNQILQGVALGNTQNWIQNKCCFYSAYPEGVDYSKGVDGRQSLVGLRPRYNSRPYFKSNPVFMILGQDLKFMTLSYQNIGFSSLTQKDQKNLKENKKTLLALKMGAPTRNNHLSFYPERVTVKFCKRFSCVKQKSNWFSPKGYKPLSPTVFAAIYPFWGNGKSIKEKKRTSNIKCSLLALQMRKKNFPNKIAPFGAFTPLGLRRSFTILSPSKLPTLSYKRASLLLENMVKKRILKNDIRFFKWGSVSQFSLNQEKALRISLHCKLQKIHASIQKNQNKTKLFFLNYIHLDPTLSPFYSPRGKKGRIVPPVVFPLPSQTSQKKLYQGFALKTKHEKKKATRASKAEKHKKLSIKKVLVNQTILEKTTMDKHTNAKVHILHLTTQTQDTKYLHSLLNQLAILRHLIALKLPLVGNNHVWYSNRTDTKKLKKFYYTTLLKLKKPVNFFAPKTGQSPKALPASCFRLAPKTDKKKNKIKLRQKFSFLNHGEARFLSQSKEKQKKIDHFRPFGSSTRRVSTIKLPPWCKELKNSPVASPNQLSFAILSLKKSLDQIYTSSCLVNKTKTSAPSLGQSPTSSQDCDLLANKTQGLALTQLQNSCVTPVDLYNGVYFLDKKSKHRMHLFSKNKKNQKKFIKEKYIAWLKKEFCFMLHSEKKTNLTKTKKSLKKQVDQTMLSIYKLSNTKNQKKNSLNLLKTYLPTKCLSMYSGFRPECQDKKSTMYDVKLTQKELCFTNPQTTIDKQKIEKNLTSYNIMQTLNCYPSPCASTLCLRTPFPLISPLVRGTGGSGKRNTGGRGVYDVFFLKQFANNFMNSYNSLSQNSDPSGLTKISTSGAAILISGFTNQALGASAFSLIPTFMQSIETGGKGSNFTTSLTPPPKAGGLEEGRGTLKQKQPLAPSYEKELTNQLIPLLFPSFAKQSIPFPLISTPKGLRGTRGKGPELREEAGKSGRGVRGWRRTILNSPNQKYIMSSLFSSPFSSQGQSPNNELFNGEKDQFFTSSIFNVKKLNPITLINSPLVAAQGIKKGNHVAPINERTETAKTNGINMLNPSPLRGEGVAKTNLHSKGRVLLSLKKSLLFPLNCAAMQAHGEAILTTIKKKKNGVSADCFLERVACGKWKDLFNIASIKKVKGVLFIANSFTPYPSINIEGKMDYSSSCAAHPKEVSCASLVVPPNKGGIGVNKTILTNTTLGRSPIYDLKKSVFALAPLIQNSITPYGYAIPLVSPLSLPSVASFHPVSLRGCFADPDIRGKGVALQGKWGEKGRSGKKTQVAKVRVFFKKTPLVYGAQPLQKEKNLPRRGSPDSGFNFDLWRSHISPPSPLFTQGGRVKPHRVDKLFRNLMSQPLSFFSSPFSTLSSPLPHPYPPKGGKGGRELGKGGKDHNTKTRRVFLSSPKSNQILGPIQSIYKGGRGSTVFNKADPYICRASEKKNSFFAIQNNKKSKSVLKTLSCRFRRSLMIAYFNKPNSSQFKPVFKPYARGVKNQFKKNKEANMLANMLQVKPDYYDDFLSNSLTNLPLSPFWRERGRDKGLKKVLIQHVYPFPFLRSFPLPLGGISGKGVQHVDDRKEKVVVLTPLGCTIKKLQFILSLRKVMIVPKNKTTFSVANWLPQRGNTLPYLLFPLNLPRRGRGERSNQRGGKKEDRVSHLFGVPSNANKKKTLSYPKEGSVAKNLQKKRRALKQRRETGRLLKRKRFYPRPVWLRFILYKKFLTSRHIKKRNQSVAKLGLRPKNAPSHTKEMLFSQGFSLTHKFLPRRGRRPCNTLKSNRNPIYPPLRGLTRNKTTYAFYPSTPTGGMEVSPGFIDTNMAMGNLLNSQTINTSLLYTQPLSPHRGDVEQSGFTFGRKRIGNSLISPTTPFLNKSTEAAIVQFQLINNPTLAIFNAFPLWGKDSIAKSVLTDFKKGLWKSSWLRSNLNAYLSKIHRIFTLIKKTSLHWELDLLSYLAVGEVSLEPLRGLGCRLSLNLSKDILTNPKKAKKVDFWYLNFLDPMQRINKGLTPKGWKSQTKINCTEYRGFITGPLAINLLKWETALQISEYNQITYDRIQQIMTNIKQSLGLSSQAITKSEQTKPRAWNNGRQKIKKPAASLISEAILFRSANKLMQTLTATPLGSNKEHPFFAINAFDNISKKRIYWALKKTNLWHYKNMNKKQYLWANQKLREQNRSNKTKKILNNWMTLISCIWQDKYALTTIEPSLSLVVNKKTDMKKWILTPPPLYNKGGESGFRALPYLKKQKQKENKIGSMGFFFGQNPALISFLFSYNYKSHKTNAATLAKIAKLKSEKIPPLGFEGIHDALHPLGGSTNIYAMQSPSLMSSKNGMLKEHKFFLRYLKLTFSTANKKDNMLSSPFPLWGKKGESNYSSYTNLYNMEKKAASFLRGKSYIKLLFSAADFIRDNHRAKPYFNGILHHPFGVTPAKQGWKGKNTNTQFLAHLNRNAHALENLAFTFIGGSFNNSATMQNIKTVSYFFLVLCIILFHLCSLFSLSSISQIRCVTKFIILLSLKVSYLYLGVTRSIFFSFLKIKLSLFPSFTKLHHNLIFPRWGRRKKTIKKNKNSPSGANLPLGVNPDSLHFVQPGWGGVSLKTVSYPPLGGPLRQGVKGDGAPAPTPIPPPKIIGGGRGKVPLSYGSAINKKAQFLSLPLLGDPLKYGIEVQLLPYFFYGSAINTTLHYQQPTNPTCYNLGNQAPFPSPALLPTLSPRKSPLDLPRRGRGWMQRSNRLRNPQLPKLTNRLLFFIQAQSVYKKNNKEKESFFALVKKLTPSVTTLVKKMVMPLRKKKDKKMKTRAKPYNVAPTLKGDLPSFLFVIMRCAQHVRLRLHKRFHRQKKELGFFGTLDSSPLTLWMRINQKIHIKPYRDQALSAILLSSAKLGSLQLLNTVLKFSLWLRWSCHSFLFKIADIPKNGMQSIYLFLEKPGELLSDWITHLFLIEIASDLTTTIPENTDTSIWNSFTKFAKASSFKIIPVIGTLLEKRLLSSFECFIEILSQPDTDLIVRQQKGKIFWDIWGEVLKGLAEENNINITLLTNKKDDQSFLFSKLLENNPINSGTLTLKFIDTNKNHPLKSCIGVTPMQDFRGYLLCRGLPFKINIGHQSISYMSAITSFGLLRTGWPNKPILKSLALPNISVFYLFCKTSNKGIDRFGAGAPALPPLGDCKAKKPLLKTIKHSPDLFSLPLLPTTPFPLWGMGWQERGSTSFPSDPQIPPEGGLEGVKGCFLSEGGKESGKIRGKKIHPSPLSPEGGRGAGVNQKENGLIANTTLKGEALWRRWSANQFMTYKGKDSDLFIQAPPAPKSLKNLKTIKHYRLNMVEPIGTIICQIYSGIFSKETASSLLVVGTASQGEALDEKSLLIQSLAGETEMKIIRDNANRYNFALGIKSLRNVFDALALHTPCIFLIEDIHIIGERRPLLVGDDENAKAVEHSSGTEPHDEKNLSVAKLTRHSVMHYKKPFRGDFSCLIPTNNYAFDLFLGVRSPRARQAGLTPLSPIPLESFAFTKDKENQTAFLSKSYLTTKSSQPGVASHPCALIFKASTLQLTMTQGGEFIGRSPALSNKEKLLAPPSTAPFTVFFLKKQGYPGGVNQKNSKRVTLDWILRAFNVIK